MIRHRLYAALLALMAAPAISSEASAQMLPFHIEEQHLAFDMTGTLLLVDVNAKLKVLETISDLEIPAFAMPIEVAEVGGATVAVTRDPMYPQWVVHLALTASAAPESELLVHIRIRGTPDCAAMNLPRLIACEWTPGHEAVVASPSPGQTFYLFNLFGSDPHEGDVVVRAPPSLEVVAGQGGPTSVTTGPDGTKTWNYAFTTPIESIPIYATDGTTLTSTSGFKVKGYFRDSMMRRTDMERAVSLASRIIPFYGQLYDMPVPVDEAHILIVPPNFYFGGIGLLGDVFWADYVVGAADYLLEQGVVHEFAHTWWGNLASGGDPAEAPFLAEAFAEYTAWRGLGHIYGDAMRTGGVRMNAVWYMYTRPPGQDIAILDPNVYNSPVYVHVTYHKGSTVVRTLEEAVGVEAFTRALRRFLKRGYGGLSVQGLLADIYRETGYDATPDVDQWMKRPGFPAMKADAAVDDTGATVHIAVAGDYHVHTPVRFTFADGTAMEASLDVPASGAMKRFELPRRPMLVEIDPRWTFVREVKPATKGDVNLDGTVDAADLIEIALHRGALPAQRRRDGHYDPFYDLDANHKVDDADLAAVVAAASVLGGR